MPDFLLEIGTEEIPAGMIAGLFTELTQRVEDGLKAAGLEFGSVKAFGAPRRIGLLIDGLPARQPDRVEKVTGPPIKIAKDAEGNWTKAAEGFARKQGVDVADLREVEGAKGPCAGFEREVKGRPSGDILAELVPPAVDALHLPKTMRWGAGEQFFVRPVRWVVALLDGDVVPMTIKGAASGRTSAGHRFHGKADVDVPSANAYFDALKKEHVVAEPAERRTKIESELSKLAAGLGGTVEADPDLLARLVYLCEYPTVLSGAIAGEYLELPTEILVTCLREHQNFFVVRDGEGKAMPHFLAVMDSPADPQGLIRKGLENVSRSRLADARFFYEHDRAVAFETRLDALKGVVFHPKLGTYYDKAVRMEAIARKLAATWGIDEEKTGWAARNCKGDLVSLLVEEKEFTSLQGVAGGLYAKAQGRDDAEWQALCDHYRPTSTDDGLPRNGVGACVAAADKLDTLREMFRIGLVPSGSKDPFALRRAAMGLLRIFMEHQGIGGLDLQAFLAGQGEVPDGLVDFLAGRLRFLWEEKGFAYDEINAVLAFGLTEPAELNRKLDAVHTVRNEFSDDFDALSVAFKRVKNILKGIPEYPLKPERFLPESDKEGAGERALYAAYESVKDKAGELLGQGAYAEALRVLSKVRPAVDTFFDDVLVMCDPEGKDPDKTALQQNRLALMQRMVALFNRIADFSEIVPRGT